MKSKKKTWSYCYENTRRLNFQADASKLDVEFVSSNLRCYCDELHEGGLVMKTGYTTEFEIMRELVKGVTFEHCTGFLVRFNSEGFLEYSNNGISFGKKTGEVNFDKPSHWFVHVKKVTRAEISEVKILLAAIGSSINGIEQAVKLLTRLESQDGIK